MLRLTTLLGKKVKHALGAPMMVMERGGPVGMNAPFGPLDNWRSLKRPTCTLQIWRDSVYPTLRTQHCDSASPTKRAREDSTNFSHCIGWLCYNLTRWCIVGTGGRGILVCQIQDGLRRPNFQFLNCYNSAVDYSISLKFGMWVRYRSTEVVQ